MSLSLSKGNGIVAKRRRQTFQATSAGAYPSGISSQIRIEMNIDRELIDFETAYLMFDLSGSFGGGVIVDPRFNPWTASSWIKDLRVYDRAGREIGEQVRQYNGLVRKQLSMLANDGANQNYMKNMEGAPFINDPTVLAETTSPLTQPADGTSQEYAHKFLTHIFDVKSYFPALLLGGLVIEIDMESAQNVIYDRDTYVGAPATTTADTPSYTLSNVRFVCDLVKLKPEFELQLLEQVNSGGLEVFYDSYMDHSQAYLGSQTNQRFDLGIANGRVKSIQSFIVKDVDRTINPAGNVVPDYWRQWQRNDLTAYRYKLGSEYLTERDIQMSSTRLVEYLAEYMKSMNLDSHDMVHFYGDDLLVLDNKFTIGQKVEVSKDPDVSSGRRDFQSNKVEIELTADGGTLAGTLYTHIFLDKVLVILPGREFRNLS